jgi:hypothetical protein
VTSLLLPPNSQAAYMHEEGANLSNFPNSPMTRQSISPTPITTVQR